MKRLLEKFGIVSKKRYDNLALAYRKLRTKYSALNDFHDYLISDCRDTVYIKSHYDIDKVEVQCPFDDTKSRAYQEKALCNSLITKMLQNKMIDLNIQYRGDSDKILSASITLMTRKD